MFVLFASPLLTRFPPPHPSLHLRFSPRLPFPHPCRTSASLPVFRSPMFVSFRTSASLSASCPLIARCVSISPLVLRSPMFVSFRTSASLSASRSLIARCVSISPFALMFPHVRIVPHLRFSPASRPSPVAAPPLFSPASRSLIARCVSISPLSIRSPMFVSFRTSASLPVFRSPMFVSFRISASLSASRSLIARCVSISPFALMFPHVRIVPHLLFSPASCPLTFCLPSASLPAFCSPVFASCRVQPPCPARRTAPRPRRRPARPPRPVGCNARARPPHGSPRAPRRSCRGEGARPGRGRRGRIAQSRGAPWRRGGGRGWPADPEGPGVWRARGVRRRRRRRCASVPTPGRSAGARGGCMGGAQYNGQADAHAHAPVIPQCAALEFASHATFLLQFAFHATYGSIWRGVRQGQIRILCEFLSAHVANLRKS